MELGEVRTLRKELHRCPERSGEEHRTRALLMDFLGELVEESGLSRELFIPLYKTVGIALVVKIGGSLCRDAGESALASVVETAGAVCALIAALPLLRAVLSLLMELMR